MKFINNILWLFIMSLLLISCDKSNEKSLSNKTEGNQNIDYSNYKIEFIELGSVNCIPCKQMQPVMKAIEQKYNGQVKVTFYDVWKDNAPAKKYGIDLIPTQVFLDKDGKEIMRHQGFFAEEEIDKFLQSQGLSISK